MKNSETHIVCQTRLLHEGEKATCCECDPHKGCDFMPTPKEEEIIKEHLYTCTCDFYNEDCKDLDFLISLAKHDERKRLCEELRMEENWHVCPHHYHSDCKWCKQAVQEFNKKLKELGRNSMDLRQQFYEEFGEEVDPGVWFSKTDSLKNTANWWLAKIEEVIDEIPDDSIMNAKGALKTLKQTLKSKYLRKE